MSKQLEQAIADAVGSAYEAGRSGWSKDAAKAIAETPLALARSLRQPPAPLLSDEERERLKGAVEYFDGLLRGLGGMSPEGNEHVVFLRTLASQEHRGEEGGDDPCPSCDLGLPTGCACADTFWRGVWVWRDSITGKLQTTTGSPELSTIPPASGMREGCRFYRPQPPAGETERLRELVEWAEAMVDSYSVAPPSWANKERRRQFVNLAAAARAMAPSDSQGDQERCDGDGRLYVSEGGEAPSNDFVPCPGCPDCNPAPTQVEGGKKPRCPTCLSSNPWFTNCKDAAQAEEETGLKVPQRGLRGGCSDPWHDERIAALSEQPEGGDGVGAGGPLGSGDDLARDPDPVPTPPGADSVSTSPEGGDEEDWPPEIELVRDVCDSPPRPVSILTDDKREHVGRFADEYETRRYIPAPSQDSSGAGKKIDGDTITVGRDKDRVLWVQRVEGEEPQRLADLLERADAFAPLHEKSQGDIQRIHDLDAYIEKLEDRASKAEAERDQARTVIARVGGIDPDEESEPFGAYRGATPITWGEAGRRIEDMAARTAGDLDAAKARAERYENALEELAAEFEQWSREAAGAPVRALGECAAKVREKAAKLKEGGS